MQITSMKINGVKEPVGFAFDRILASWKVTDTESTGQTGVQIVVSTHEDLSDPLCTVEGLDLSSAETLLPLSLQPRTRYFWQVTVTGNGGDTASGKSFFETGKMTEPWTGKWIACEAADKRHPVFARQFAAEKPVKARLYITAVGLFEAYLNGSKVGDDFLAPFLTDYVENVQVLTYDITDLLQAENDLQIMVGPGWYMSVFGLALKENNFGDRMMTMAEVILTYEDGHEEVIGTDNSWLYKGSDIEKSGIYFGEIFNRQLYQAGENPWKQAVEAEEPTRPVDRYGVSVKVKEELKVVEVLHTPAGETVLDFGQNHAGFMQFENHLPAGTTVLFEVGETLQQGNFYHKNYRDAESIFRYTSDGRAETVRPHFTSYGYRYVKVTGWPGEVTREDVVSQVIYSDLDITGNIETSNAKINRLFLNTLWGQKSNFVDIPTDCPQRSERLGWTGDTQVFSQTASYNMDTRPFYAKFFRDLRTEQLRADGAVPSFFPTFGGDGMSGGASIWGDVGTFVPDVLMRTFASPEQMKSYYPMMKDWVEWMYRKDAEAGDLGLLKLPFQFGDWLGLDGATEASYKGGSDDDFLGSCYYYQSTKITGQMAERLGFTEDAARYAALSEKIKSAVRYEYFSGSGRLATDTQAAYIVALKFGLYTDEQKLLAQFLQRLQKDHYKIRCGFVGAPLMCTTLAEHGLTDLAYSFLFQEGFPSWLYAINLGATTIWERWNSILPDGTICPGEMNSLNHYSYGTITEFLYTRVCGLRAAAPGFRRAIIAPEPSMKFRWVNCSYDSVFGKYVTNWNISEEGIFSLHVEVPFSCSADITLPRYDGQELSTAQYSTVTGEEIVPSDEVWVEEDGSVTVPAGSYTFTYFPSQDYRMVYSEKTRLDQLASDPEVMALLKEKLPGAYEIIENNDPEWIYTTLGDLRFLFFRGFNPQLVQPVLDEICTLNRW